MPFVYAHRPTTCWLRAWPLFLATVAAFLIPTPSNAQVPLRFVGDKDYPPLSYLENGEPRGFDVDVVLEVGRILRRVVRIDLIDWTDAQNAVRQGEADGLTDLAISEERRAVFDFAESTITHDFGLFVRRGDVTTGTLNGVRGKTVGITAAGYPREFFLRRPDVRLEIVPDYNRGFDRLIAGSLDAVAADMWSGAATIEQRGLTGVSLGGAPFASLPAAIAVRKGRTELIADINLAIREMQADGTLQEIRERWAPQEMVFLSRERVQNLMLWGAGGLLGVLLVGTTLWALTLQRQVRFRRRVEAQLVESGQRLGLALAAANLGTWRVSLKTNIETRDANLNRMLGLEPIESTGDAEDAFRRVHPEDREQVRAEFERAIREHVGYMTEFRIIQPDGSVRTLRGRGRVFYADSGEPEYATGAAVDITEEMESAERGRLLAHALQSAKDCIVITDPSRQILYVNDAFLRTYEYEEHEILGQNISVVAINQEGESSALSAAQADGWRGEVNNRSKTGRVFPISLATSVVRNVRGEIVAVVSVTHDITDRKHAEDALRASEERFSKAFEASPDAITIHDFGDRGVLAVNEAFERITGYSRSEILGRTMKELGIFVDPNFRDTAVERLRQEGIRRDVEFQIRRKNGEIATLMLSGATIDVAGRPCFLTVTRDITERKRFELHLRQAAELNKLLLAEMDLDGLSVAVVEAVHKILPLDYASLVLAESGSGALRLKAQRGVLEAGRATSAAQVLAALEPKRDGIHLFRRAELEALGEPVEPLLQAGVQSVGCLPLVTARGRLGALVVGSASPAAFSDHDVTLLYQLSTYVAIAIQNARSYEEIKALKDQVSQEKLYLQEEIRVDHNFTEIVGDSAAIKRVLQQIETVAPTDASVLILGETGTGKELIARALHELSPRKDRTFVRMNVAALPSTLLESELFGYERGAFTGAATSKIGRMELAHRGTLFLDEVGDIPLEVQPKLLRVLQEREFERLGSTRTQRADVRMIAATNRDLQEMVDDGTFRSDLFYRLNVFPLHVPPLRDRKDDIPVLVRYFVQKFATRFKRRITTIPASTMAALQEWHWPGNIRELENVVERAVIVSTGDTLQVPAFQVKQTFEGLLPKASSPPPTARPLSTFSAGERDIILDALRAADGIIAGPAGAAARLGMKRTTLQSKMRKLGIRRPTF